MAGIPLPESAKVTSLKEITGNEFSFIIIGGGTSGCLLASRLASAPVSPRHKVLLVEAGGEAEEDPENLIPGLVVPRFGNEEGNWLYQTAPQSQLNGRTIVYPRGRGMGGSSANNFSSWVRGPKCDWDDWAEAVGDDWWRWENAVEYMKDLEDFHAECPPGMEGYVTPTEGMHHVGGPVGVGTGKVWQPLIQYCLDGAREAGHRLNTDHNDGDETGISVAQMNVDYGVRRSSAAAFLGSAASTPGMADDSITVHASQEIIVSAGTFETPHILLLSGVGPASALAAHDIPCVLDAPNLGQNIRDHSAFSIEAIIDPSIAGHNQLLRNPDALAAARKEYASTQTGPLAVFGASACMLFARIPALYTSPEFHALPPSTQTFLSHPSRPSTELWLHGGPLFYQGAVGPKDSIIAVEGLCQNLLSKGSLTLQSADPRQLPAIDPAYCTNAYDWRIAIETIKLQLRIANTPTMRKIIQRPLHGPGERSEDGTLTLCDEDDEEAIREFLRAELTQGFHSMGSCVMGRADNADRVVDAQFKVVGLEGLRVADMSICPVLTNNHTQINAYLIAERCAQVILGDEGRAGYSSKL